MKIEQYATKHNIDIETFKDIASYVCDELNLPQEERVSILKSLVEDEENLIPDTEVGNFLKKLMATSLFEKYYSTWGKYRRIALKEVNNNYTFEAIQNFNSLINNLDKMTSLRSSIGENILKDIQDLKTWIMDTMNVCIKDDGVISSEEFDSFYGILYGIYEGLLSLIGKVSKDEVSSKFLNTFRVLTKDKAFRETLLKSEDSLDILKGLFSLGTHLVITAQNNQELKEDSLNLLKRLMENIDQFIKTGDKKILDQVIF